MNLHRRKYIYICLEIQSLFFFLDMILQQYWQKFRSQSGTFNLRGWARIRFGKQLLLTFCLQRHRTWAFRTWAPKTDWVGLNHNSEAY